MPGFGRPAGPRPFPAAADHPRRRSPVPAFSGGAARTNARGSPGSRGRGPGAIPKAAWDCGGRRAAGRKRTDAGGLDSGCILAGLVAAGRDFEAYTLRFGESPSLDEETAAQRLAALCPGKPLHVIDVPRSVTRACDIAHWTIESATAVLKTAVEVMVVMDPLLFEVACRGHKTVLIRTAARTPQAGSRMARQHGVLSRRGKP